MTRPRPFRGRIFPTLVVLLLAAIAWLAWDRFQPGPPTLGERPPVTGDSRPRGVYYGPPNSVAVLPFGSDSGEPDRTVRAEGFASEILGALVEVTGLQVTARSSSFFFRGEGADFRVISERLQSRHLLSGEWRGGPDGIDLTLSLYDALAGRETWRKAYPASLQELLDLRDAICADVVAALPVPPQPCAHLKRRVDAQAWTRYAEGLRYADPSAEQDLERAGEALRSALAIDPGFQAARIELAGLLLHPARIAGDAGQESVTLARGAVQTALDDHPDAARAWSLLSYIRHRYDWDWDGAVSAGRRAAGLSPGDAGVLGVASLALTTVGDFGPAQEFLEGSVRRDPLNLGRRLRLGLLQEFRGDYEAALASYRQVLTMKPDYPGGHAYRARVRLLQGKSDSALQEAEQETDPFWRLYARNLALNAGRESGDAEAALREMIDEHGSVAAFQIAEILAFAGERERAFEWLQRARAQHDPGVASALGNRFLENLHDDPRWPEWLAGMGLPANAGEQD